MNSAPLKSIGAMWTVMRKELRDIFRDREIGKQRGLLINTGDAELTGTGGCESGERLAGEGDGAAVGLMRAGDDFDQRAFSSSVLTQQSQYFARSQHKIHASQRLDPGKRLFDSLHLQKWRWRRCWRVHA